MPEISDPTERLRLLRDNCDDREETHYIKPLTPEELDVKREQLADNCIEQNRLEEELTEIKKDYKDKIDPIKTDNKILCQQIKTHQEEATGELYHIYNHDEGMRETYDEQGLFVSSRRLRPEEKQGKLFLAKASNQ